MFFLTISEYDFPLNGNRPVKIIQKIIPAEYMSTLKSYGRSLRISGATYPGVPHFKNNAS